MTIPRFRLTDSTLRDGSHAIAHQFSEAQVHEIVSALDRANVPVIEVSHGDGLSGSSFNYGFIRENERDLLKVAVKAAKRAKIAVLLLPGIGVSQDLEAAAEIGVGVARVATHCTEADISEQHIRLARRLGMETVGFLMMSHMIDESQLVEQAKLMESYGAQSVYVVDSAGAMTIDDAKRRVAALKSSLECQVGIHAHNNLSLAVANSMAALEEGVDQIDGCMTGLGAGAGNCPTEAVVAVCEKAGIPTGIDALALFDVAQDVVRPIRPEQGVIDRDGLLLGYAGVYGSFLLHARNASVRYGVPVKDILMEVGRRKLVGGQEDLIIDIAIALARATRG